jgi:DNA-binding response OmpR family regulator
MDVFLSKIRKYLKEDPSVEIINVHGKGYKLLVN